MAKKALTEADIVALASGVSLEESASTVTAETVVQAEAFAEAGATEAQQAVAFVGPKGQVSMPGIQDAELRRQREALESLFVAYQAGRISLDQFSAGLASGLATLQAYSAALDADTAAMEIMRAGFSGVQQNAAGAAAGMTLVTASAIGMAGAMIRTIGPLTQAAAALSAWDTTVGALVPNLDSVSESTDAAIERIKGIGLGGVDVLGASGAIDQIHAYEDALQGLRDKAIANKWTDLELATAQQELFNQFGNPMQR
jgi:hypothetical protein